MCRVSLPLDPKIKEDLFVRDDKQNHIDRNDWTQHLWSFYTTHLWSFYIILLKILFSDQLTASYCLIWWIDSRSWQNATKWHLIRKIRRRYSVYLAILMVARSLMVWWYFQTLALRQLKMQTASPRCAGAASRECTRTLAIKNDIFIHFWFHFKWKNAKCLVWKMHFSEKKESKNCQNFRKQIVENLQILKIKVARRMQIL